MTAAKLREMKAVADEARESPFHPDALTAPERRELDVLAFGMLRLSDRRATKTTTDSTGARVVHVHPRKA